MSVAEAQESPILAELAAIVGGANVLTDERARVLYAQDVQTKDLPALAVVRPSDTAQLSAVVRAVTAAGNAIVARGGGMSYTKGYVPSEPDSVIVDTQAMNRVLEINREDMYVTVECGCSWKSLYEALEGSGLRTTFWGTLSGIHATVGGGISQNGIFWGSGRHGTAADAVLSLDIVLADGTVVSTGSAAQSNGTPFFRHYGPDLTGIFTSDTGALGLKATATLRLVPVCEHRGAASFDFADHSSVVAAMSDIARAGIADECFAFDPFLKAVGLKRQSLISDVRQLAGVMKSGGGVLGAIREGTRVALKGRGFMKDVNYALHVSVEERVEAALRQGVDEIRQICARHGGTEIENSIPKILRANPFTPLNNVVGPNGERWLPIHALLPHSKAGAAMEAVRSLLDEHENGLESHGIGVGFLFATVSTNGFVLEPVFFTPDALAEIHEATVEAPVWKRLPRFDANPAAAAYTIELKEKVVALFKDMGGIHMQIGKAYPYRDGIEPQSWRIVEALKQALDPDRRVNPGSLGLD